MLEQVDLNTPSPDADLLSIRESEAPKSILYLVDKPNGFSIHFSKPAPNRFHRFMQRLLLGWRWEEV